MESITHKNLIVPGMGNILDHIEGGTQTIWRSKSCECSRYTFTGARGKDVDILIDKRLNAHYPMVRIEVATVHGRFDGAARDRYVFRMPERGDQCAYVAACVPFVRREEHSVVFTIDDLSGAAIVDVSYRVLTSEIDRTDPESLARMLTAHAFGQRRADGCTIGGYFRHLDAQTVDSCASEFIGMVLENETWTKAEAYRCAGRILYRESRNLGWRKLTLREKKKHGIPADAGQWHRAENIYDPTGCGEATLRGSWDDEYRPPMKARRKRDGSYCEPPGQGIVGEKYQAENRW
jgi:hypothetical protein